MKCKVRDCRYNTDEDADDKTPLGEKLQLLGFHELAEHTPEPVCSVGMGRQQFKSDKALLLKHMEQLSVEFQNPVVYMQEFFDIKKMPDEGIRHFLSRLQGVL